MDAEVIIVGGGIVGLWSAYLLAKQGIETILFEQFPYPHTRGSSHGHSRIIRSLYCEEEYASMMPECYRMWKELEKEADKQLMLKTGLVGIYNMFKSSDVTAFYQAVDQMDKLMSPFEIIPGELLQKRFPGLRFDSKHRAIYDENAALLNANSCLMALQELYVQHGGRIHDGEGVVSIRQINESKIEMVTAKTEYCCQSVILACGPFSNQVLSSTGVQLPLTVMKPVVLYWKVKSDGYSVSKNFPSTSLRDSFYSLPSYEYPGMIKLCYDAVVSVDPEAEVLSTEKQDIECQRMADFKRQICDHFPNVDATDPAIVGKCVYTKTPDYGFVIDYHPKYQNVIIGAGFSGHGFKTAPAVGHMLSNMALGLLPPYPLQPFSASRFFNQSRL